MLPERQHAVLQADCYKRRHVTPSSAATAAAFTAVPIVSMGNPKSSSVISSVDGRPWRLTIRTVPVQQISRPPAERCLTRRFMIGQAAQTCGARPVGRPIRGLFAAHRKISLFLFGSELVKSAVPNPASCQTGFWDRPFRLS